MKKNKKQIFYCGLELKKRYNNLCNKRDTIYISIRIIILTKKKIKGNRKNKTYIE